MVKDYKITKTTAKGGSFFLSKPILTAGKNTSGYGEFKENPYYLKANDEIVKTFKSEAMLLAYTKKYQANRKKVLKKMIKEGLQQWA